MRYFPLFADLDKARRAGRRRRRAGRAEGAPAAQDQRAHHGRRRKPSPTSCASSRRAAALWILLRARSWPRDLEGQRLVYAATGDRLLDAAVSRAARARGIPVNVVDAPELSTFIMPAIVDRDPVTVAIGTEGAAPVLAREIKTRLETLAARQFRRARASAPKRCATPSPRPFADARARRRLWERLLQGPFRRAVLSGAEAEAGRILAAELHGADGGPATPVAWR